MPEKLVQVMFRIRRKSDGLFARADGRFTKSGKFFRGIGPLKLHLNEKGGIWKGYDPQAGQHKDDFRYAGCELVEYHLLEVESSEERLANLYEEREEHKAQRKAEQAARSRKAAEERDRKEFERLRQEFGST